VAESAKATPASGTAVSATADLAPPTEPLVFIDDMCLRGSLFPALGPSKSPHRRFGGGCAEPLCSSNSSSSPHSLVSGEH
jgi:hypothetical protein